jgi:hypothetical protein
MNNDTEVEELFERADEYASFAIEHLLLEPGPQDPLPGDDPVSEIVNAVNPLMAQYPHRFMEMNRPEWVIRFIFPSLSKDQLDKITRLRCASSWFRSGKINIDSPTIGKDCADRLPESLKHFRKAKADVRDMEKEFTSLQLRALDSDYFNWPAIDGNDKF